MTYYDAERVMNRLKKAGIDCHIVVLQNYDNAGCVYYVCDKDEKCLCTIPSDGIDYEFVMQGPLKFDNDSLCCNPVDLYRFNEKKEDLEAMTDEFIARHKICQKIQKLFNSEIYESRKCAREAGSDNANVKARIKELNKNMYDAYRVQEIGLVS